MDCSSPTKSSRTAEMNETIEAREDVQLQQMIHRAVLRWAVVLALVVATAAAIAWYIHTQDVARQNERIVARYVLCLEIDSLKGAARASVMEGIEEREVLLQGGFVTGIEAERLQREIDRSRRFLESLKPYPGGCAAFARDPESRDVRVPEVES